MTAFPAASTISTSAMALEARTLVIATAGHIDHGKTTLVRALTGIDADRLPEEKRRGITIDLGFASMELRDTSGTPMRISFVDVPGHALFIRNMLAGAGCVPAVLLVVAADEGIKPQTIEHLAICELLGITQGVIAITKSDCVSRDQQDQVTENVRALVQGTFLRDAPALAVSARSGQGVAALCDALINIASRVRAGNSSALMRLPIDRVFVMKGFGTVVTGTLLSGVIREGETLLIEPGGRNARARGLQTHGHAEHEAQAGTRVAVNLAGIDFADVHRGQTLVAPHTFSALTLIDVEIRLLPTAPPLKQGARVHFHAFTSEGMAVVSFYGNDSARPGSTRMARLKLDEPVVVAPGDRFVLRQPAPVATIGGGRVLDCHPERRQRKAVTVAWLEKIAIASLADQLALRVKRRGANGIRIPDLAREAGIRAESARGQVDSAIQTGKIALIGDELLVDSEALLVAKGAVVSLLERLGRKPGTSIKSSELRNQTSLRPEVFDSVVHHLARDGRVQARGEELSLGTSERTSARESEQLVAIARAYEAAGLAAPLVSELRDRFRVSDAEMRRMITLLQREKTIVRMGSDDLFIHAKALGQLASRMASLRGKVIDVAAFKQLTGLSRKYAIPLLEYLDHARVTRKQGDGRLVL